MSDSIFVYKKAPQVAMCEITGANCMDGYQLVSILFAHNGMEFYMTRAAARHLSDLLLEKCLEKE